MKEMNFVYIHPWVAYHKENIWHNTDDNMTQLDKRFTAVNSIAFLISKSVQTILVNYCNKANMLERFHPRINMKNEFYFPKLLLANVKKRYVGSMRLKEGMELYPEEIEIKGHDFKKAGVTIETTHAMESIIKKNILDENIETVDIVGVLSDISAFENEIRRSLLEGEKTYLLRMKAKTPDSYESDPFRHRQVVGVYNWNSLYPENEIEHSAIIYVALTKDITAQAIEKYKDKYPNEYNRMHKYIFTHPDKKISNGIVCVAIPNNIDKIPDFIREFIDIDYIISRNINTFKPIMTALGMPGVRGSDITTASGGKKKTEFYSNIIDI